MSGLHFVILSTVQYEIIICPTLKQDPIKIVSKFSVCLITHFPHAWLYNEHPLRIGNVCVTRYLNPMCGDMWQKPFVNESDYTYIQRQTYLHIIVYV